MTGERVPLFWQAKMVKKFPRTPWKSIAHKRLRSEILDLTEDPPMSIPPEREVPRESSSLNPSISGSLPEEDVDSAPKIDEESTLWRKQDVFRASRPLLLERIRKDYDAIRDPLEIHGVVARHLIKALNASHALACRADLLGDARAEACEKERPLQFQVVELTKEVERLKVAATLALKEKKEATA
ncbi:hypothetical protein LIER_14682 [Lithospermum erythrorhizon]|uniref:Uncharacterized protein n=1 Tax=Lithospermum erythrorhizon TaxID=34254 RepID=A0AAV3Q052_LITER